MVREGKGTFEAINRVKTGLYISPNSAKYLSLSLALQCGSQAPTQRQPELCQFRSVRHQQTGTKLTRVAQNLTLPYADPMSGSKPYAELMLSLHPAQNLMQPYINIIHMKSHFQVD